jgi:chromatin remodeling complex protein RSC6
MMKLTPTSALAEIIGSKPTPRGQAIKGVWAYIKKHGLQDSKNRRNINTDAKLASLCKGKKTVSMFELAKFVSNNLKK